MGNRTRIALNSMDSSRHGEFDPPPLFSRGASSLHRPAEFFTSNPPLLPISNEARIWQLGKKPLQKTPGGGLTLCGHPLSQIAPPLAYYNLGIWHCPSCLVWAAKKRVHPKRDFCIPKYARIFSPQKIGAGKMDFKSITIGEGYMCIHDRANAEFPDF